MDGCIFVREGGGRRRVSRAVPIHRSQVMTGSGDHQTTSERDIPSVYYYMAD